VGLDPLPTPKTLLAFMPELHVILANAPAQEHLPAFAQGWEIHKPPIDILDQGPGGKNLVDEMVQAAEFRLHSTGLGAAAIASRPFDSRPYLGMPGYDPVSDLENLPDPRLDPGQRPVGLLNAEVSRHRFPSSPDLWASAQVGPTRLEKDYTIFIRSADPELGVRPLALPFLGESAPDSIR